MRQRFDGMIAGVGTASGTRVVVGLWARSPLGPIVDAMVETRDGHRVLLAPTDDVARFIAATYTFDEIRVETLSLRSTDHSWTVAAPSLSLEVQLGHRTIIGRLLSLVPRAVATAPAWSRLIDPAARVLRPGVRTVGSAGGGRREYYGALDEHALTGIDGAFEGRPLGELRDLTPPVRFGFGSAPRRPSLVRIVTTIDVP